MKPSRPERTPPPGKNRLIFEKSPYLLQHAENPVDWYPWSEDAFDRAKREDKPVFVSIGYSTCHWCHVMAHESFEDPGVAALMNAAFVNVKVDREERPDIDAVYMSVCQLVRGNGGWPLTAILTPDKKPFFVATYLPRESRQGMTGMLDLVPHVERIWRERRREVDEGSEDLSRHLAGVFERRRGENAPGVELLHAAFAELGNRFDESNGGFGRAPKFPAPHALLFLLRYWRRTGDAHALEMTERTLRRMARGGIYDHVGFGFHRYSTDERWFAPHFEKMLYDQALLAMAYTECFLATGKAAYRRTAEEILSYIMRDMTDPGGGFYSAEDADSEGTEGKFYLWTLGELEALLGGEDGRLAADLYGVEPAGNFADEVAGGNILHLRRPIEKSAEELGVAPEDLRRRLDRIGAVLLAARGRRVRPYRDDKILADWNGLMIAAFSLETTFDPHHLARAVALTDEMIRLFWDGEGGGFYFTRADGEGMIVRTRAIYDGAIPSGNSAAAVNLIRLARLTGDARYEERAENIGRVVLEDLTRAPSGYAWFAAAVDLAQGPSVEVVIVGEPGTADTDAMIRAVR
ncbi:MAG: Thioredoxin-related protein, partial [Candidatus Krumholzibacteriota bacterium]|nr:Thioredoxin-related protein [Candidatus Krumholzibacteriota bacterium]